MDNASPVVTGTLGENIRIAAMKTPVVDKNVGGAASIRIVNPQSMTKADFVDGGSATDEMLDFFAVMRTKIPGSVFLLITHDNKEQILAKAASKGIPAEAVIVQPAGRDEVPLFLSISDWNLFLIKDAYSKTKKSDMRRHIYHYQDL